MVGKALSHYKILNELGRGGMGIVYKAEDTKLDRTVAIKVLPPAALSNEDDRARFYREAKAAAQLHHPHIASVFEIDEAVPEGSKDDDLRPFISMEYIQGETLSDRIQDGPLKLEEAVRIASQIASGLEAAHEKDIVHRDLKSQNVMLTAKGEAKVLDFGLAQTAASTKLTRMGNTLGTVAYMSPEQARGEAVDHRTDLWSLGVVLYEMISGRSPFPGDYEQAVVYEILNQDPEPLTAIRTGVPMELERITKKCLAKSRDLRYQGAVDLLVDLKSVDVSVSTVSVTSSQTHVVSRLDQVRDTGAIRRAPVTLIFGLLAALALGVLIGYLVFDDKSESKGSQTVRTSLVFPEDAPVALIGTSPYYAGRKAFDISRDGSLLAAVVELSPGQTQISLRQLGSYELSMIEGTAGAYSPVLSPDASSVAFFADEQLKVIPISGGTPRTLTDVRNPNDAVWHPTAGIIFADNENGSLYRVSPENGHRQLISDGTFGNPSLLPTGEHILVLESNEIVIVAIEDGVVTRLGIGGASSSLATPNFIRGGHLVFAEGPALMAAPFNLSELTITGSPSPVVSNVRIESLAFVSQYAVSENGSLIYADGGDVRLGHLYSIDRSGADVQISTEPQIFGEMRLSPDGRKLAICVLTNDWDIWIYDVLEQREPQLLTIEGSNYDPVWSPDGQTIFFNSDRSGTTEVYSKPANATSQATQVPIFLGNRTWDWIGPEAISPNNEWLLVQILQENTGPDLVATSLTSDSSFVVVSEMPFVEWGASFSPDGRFVAFNSDEVSTLDVYVTPFPEGGSRMRVSFPSGMDPLWSEDGNSVYYHDVRKIYQADIQGIEAGDRPEVNLVFTGDYADLGGVGWAVDSQRDKFYMVKSLVTETTTRNLNLIVNFDKELARTGS